MFCNFAMGEIRLTIDIRNFGPLKPLCSGRAVQYNNFVLDSIAS